MTNVFISHSSKDRVFARRLSRRLKAERVKVWIDQLELVVGDPLPQRLADAVNEADHFIVVLSKHSINSEWVEKELELALAKERRLHAPVIVPVMLGSVQEQLPLSLRNRVHADFRSEDLFETSLAEILRSIGFAKSLSDLLDEMDDETNASQLETIHGAKSRRQTRDGREFLTDLASNPELDVVSYRKWMLYELIKLGLEDKYMVNVKFGRYNPETYVFGVWDPILRANASVQLEFPSAEKGIFETEFDTTFERKISTKFIKTMEEKFIASPSGFITNPGLPSSFSGFENPESTRAKEVIAPILEYCRKPFMSKELDVRRSIIASLQQVTLGNRERLIRFRVGRIDFGFCALERPPTNIPVCEPEVDGCLYFEIYDTFFATSNVFFLCVNHRQKCWDAEVNLLGGNHNHPVIGLH